MLGWAIIMVEEMSAFQSSGIWGIVPLFLGKSIVGYCGLLQLKLVLMVRLMGLRLD